MPTLKPLIRLHQIPAWAGPVATLASVATALLPHHGRSIPIQLQHDNLTITLGAETLAVSVNGGAEESIDIDMIDPDQPLQLELQGRVADLIADAKESANG